MNKKSSCEIPARNIYDVEQNIPFFILATTAFKKLICKQKYLSISIDNELGECCVGPKLRKIYFKHLRKPSWQCTIAKKKIRYQDGTGSKVTSGKTTVTYHELLAEIMSILY